MEMVWVCAKAMLERSLRLIIREGSGVLLHVSPNLADDAGRLGLAHGDELLELPADQELGLGAEEGRLVEHLGSATQAFPGAPKLELSDIATERQGNALVRFRVYSYRARERVAVEVYLKNTGSAPWTAAGAVLRGPKGEVLKPMLL
jgi:hypothetical protein